MTPEQFCYWLNGFREIAKSAPTDEQWDIIKNRLDNTKASDLLADQLLDMPLLQSFGLKESDFCG